SRKRRLGKGLGALIGEADTESMTLSTEKTGVAAVEGGLRLPLARISNNRFQPRRLFNPEAIEEMASSIEAQGLIQPVVVNDRGDGNYELISGERRLRAVRKLGWKDIPAVVRKVSDEKMLEITLVENLQREDLSPVEEAAGYKRLVEEFSLTQAEIAQRVGKDRATVANTLRLLRLPPLIQQAIATGAITAGHARQLLAVDDEAEQLELARKVIKQDISVRKLEKIVRQRNRAREGRETKDAGREQGLEESREAFISDLEEKLRRHMGTKVRIRDNGKGKGRIEIEFYSFEEFERLMELFHMPLA
ncbi:MAG: ParB/RepB/Spo0J family partition protein, partial [Gemmatimonadota bacterium]|nr:ParB/RepB/Spo0J family partition protein [Gemmatimonadota bacterium]